MVRVRRRDEAIQDPAVLDVESATRKVSPRSPASAPGDRPRRADGSAA
jgi:hypothetical protein